MGVNKDFEDLLRCLNQEKTEFIIVGAYAVIFYTEPRYTKDIDFWINPTTENAQKVLSALKKFGAPTKNLTVEDLTNNNMVYQIGIEPNRIDIIMNIAGVNFSDAWKKKNPTSYGNEKAYILDLNDLIKAKKKAGRPRDLLDLEKLEMTLALRQKDARKRAARKRKKKSQ